MNRSGQAVAALANFFGLNLKRFWSHMMSWICHPVCKLKQGGGHGGHNGLRDIIASLANQNNFHRLRIGIGHPGHSSQVSNYVLSRAPRSEQDLTNTSIEFALGVLPDLLDGNFSRAMQQLHSQKA